MRKSFNRLPSKPSARFVPGIGGILLTILAWLMIKTPVVATLGLVTADYLPASDEIELAWEGDAEAFGVEMSFDFVNWQTIVFTDESTARISVDPDNAMFLRVAELPEGEELENESPERLAILESIRQQLLRIPDGSVEEENEAYAEILQGVSVLSNVQIANECVWAEFADGKILAVINNRDHEEDTFNIDPPEESGFEEQWPTMTSAPSAQGVEIDTRVATGPTNFPESKKVFIASSNQVWLRMGGDLASWFKDMGYEVVHTNASLLSLWNVKDAGVFYFEGHGGYYPQIGENGLSVLVTDTEVTQSLNKTLKNSIDGYAIVSPTRRHLFWKTHYVITQKFTSSQMSFKDNSLVFLNGCNGFPMSSGFGPKPLVISWKNNTKNLPAFRAARYYFDRMLGINRGWHLLTTEFKADPPQRAFDHGAVHLSMVQQGLHSTVSTTEGEITDPKDGEAKLFSGGNQSAFGILAPSIERIFVEEPFEQLRIIGNFDPTVSTEVRVHHSGGFQKITPTSISKITIVCPLKASTEMSAVEIQVLQRGHWSNRIPITEYSIPVYVERGFIEGIAEPKAVSELILHFRLGLHSFRTFPERVPVFAGAGATLSKLSTGRVVSAFGTYTDEDGHKTEWKLESPVEVPFEKLRGTLNIGSDYKVNLFGGLLAGNVMTIINTPPKGEPTVVQAEPGTAAQPGGVNSVMGAEDYKIAAGNGTAGGNIGVFRWEVTSPINSPTGGFAR